MKTFILDGEPIVRNSPPPCETSVFQRELDRIFGKEPNGKSRFRVVWGQDLGLGQAVDWDHINQQWRARYVLTTSKSLETYTPAGSKIIKTKWVWNDIGVPRWFLERYIPPAVACLGWVVEGVDSDGQYFYDPKPVNGLYEPFADSMLADHTPWCCEEASGREEVCYGAYRPPDDEDLLAIREAKQLLDDMRERRPGVQTAEDREKAAKTAVEKYEAWLADLKQTTAEIVHDALKTHQSQLSDDPSVVANGRFHFLSGTSKAGLTALQRNRVLRGQSAEDNSIISDKE